MNYGSKGYVVLEMWNVNSRFRSRGGGATRSEGRRERERSAGRTKGSVVKGGVERRERFGDRVSAVIKRSPLGGFDSTDSRTSPIKEQRKCGSRQ